MIKKNWILMACIALFAIGCSGGSDDTAETTGTTGSGAPATTGTTGTTGSTPPATTASYIDVQEILNKNCIGCHGDRDPKEDLNLTTYESLMKGGEHGPVVIPGDAEKSRIVMAIHGNGIKQMPLNGAPLSAEDMKKIEDWIKAGAKKEN